MAEVWLVGLMGKGIDDTPFSIVGSGLVASESVACDDLIHKDRPNEGNSLYTSSKPTVVSYLACLVRYCTICRNPSVTSSVVSDKTSIT